MRLAISTTETLTDLTTDLIVENKKDNNVYLDNLKFCVVCINGQRYVCYSECNVVSDECDEPSPCLVRPVGAHGGYVMYFWIVYFRGELSFLHCDDICMCVMNKQCELLQFVFDNLTVLHDP